MNIVDLSSRDVAVLTVLFKRREKLKARLVEVIAKIDSIGSRRSKNTAHAAKKASRSSRSPLSEGILTILKAADSKGIHIDAIAKKLNREKRSVHAWFYGTGKKRAKKVARATYVLA